MISPLFRMTGDEARGLLFGLVESDKLQLQKHPDMPSMRELIRTGKVRYDPNDPQEHWKTYRELVEDVEKNGVAYGDCEDLAVAVAAEDQVFHGVQSLPFAYSPRQGLFHVVTAVPASAVRSSPRETVSGESGRIPFGFEAWPVAMGAHSVPGYVLQDPSRAAGMGSFGYAPDVEAGMSRFGAYGAEGRSGRGSGRGLGGAFRALRDGVLGGGSTRSTLTELGSGVRKGAGMDQGWAGRLGEQIPGALGIGRPVEPKEGSAVKALRKGMDSEEEAPSRAEEDDGSDFDDEDLGDDEEFGGLGDAVVSEMFGLDDEDLDLDVGDGSPKKFSLSRLPDWVLPAAIGTAAGAALVGTGVALLGKGNKRRRNKYAPEVPPVEEDVFGDDLDDDLDDDFDDLEDDLDEFGDDEFGDDEFGDDEFGDDDDLDDGAESFAGIGTLVRSDLFAGDFRMVHDEDDEEDLLLDED